MKFVENKSNKVIAAVLLAVCFSLFFCCGSAWAVVDAPDSVYVGDYANVLTEETEQYIIAENRKLCEATGAQIVIVANGYNYALSTTQNGNNRGQAAVTKNATDNTVTFGDGVQIITVEAGKVSGTFAFNVGTGYLYAASSGSNYLRTEKTFSNNSSWTISIDSKGVATIKAQGSYTRNVMQYNQSSSLFSCYGSASLKAISIYILK
jgi:hypothetical protein